MKVREAKKLKVHDLVKWIGFGEPIDGEVVAVSEFGFQVRWSDTLVGNFKFDDHVCENMQLIPRG